MKVCIGSVNEAKVKGVVKAFKVFFKDFEVAAIDLSGLVSAQPFSIEEAVEGAHKRARLALSSIEGCDYGVGVEAGLFKIKDAWFAHQIACIVHKDGLCSYGLSPAFQVPPKVVGGVLSGRYRELEEAVNEYFSKDRVGEREGLIGILTDNVIVRSDLTFVATYLALIPHVKRELY